MNAAPHDDLTLSRVEWQAVSIALKDAATAACPAAANPGPAARLFRAITGAAPARPLADPRLEAVRSFVCATRRHSPRAQALVPQLADQGFNPRQIEALARLAA